MTAAARRAENDNTPQRALGLGLLGGITDAPVTDASLARWWASLSASCFDGKLPVARIVVARCGSPRALSESSCDTLGWLVRIAPHVKERGELYVVAQLLHEGCHVWCREMLGDAEEPYGGHGPRWCAMANEIARRLRLGVLTRPSGGKGYLTPGAWPGVWGDRGASAPLVAAPTTAAPEGDLARPQRAVDPHALDALHARLEAAETEVARLRGVVEYRDGQLSRVWQWVTERRELHAEALSELKRGGQHSGGNAWGARKLIAEADEVRAAVGAIVRESNSDAIP